MMVRQNYGYTSRIRDAAAKAGWPVGSHIRWWQADHIIPHSEGGEFVLENLRTLCVPCHKERTKQWHRAKRLAPKTTMQEVLAL